VNKGNLEASLMNYAILEEREKTPIFNIE